jgi:hypothetical protein
VPQRIAGRVLSPGDFFRALLEALAHQLPAELTGFEARRGPGRLIKVHYGRPQIHYEAWHHTRSGRLEVGLHFEAEAELNLRARAYFGSRLLEVKGRIYAAELEPWDRGWCRMYETVPAPMLSDGLVAVAAERLAVYITTLQPLLEEFWSEEEEMTATFSLGSGR